MFAEQPWAKALSVATLLKDNSITMAYECNLRV